MRSIALFAILASTANLAQAFNFGPAASCPTYCLGFTTDDPAYTLDWLNAVYANTSQPHTLLSVNGKSYSGPTLATITGTALILGHVHTFYDVSGVLVAADGSAVTVDYSLEYWSVYTSSGRAHGHVPHRAIAGGSIQ